LPAEQASVRHNPPDPGIRCAAKIGPGEYEFYLPGAKVTDKDGNKWVCGPDGQWFRDYSSRAASGVSITSATASFSEVTLQASPNVPFMAPAKVGAFSRGN
jgi:hypothetical protein